MKELLDTILHPAGQPAHSAALPLPRACRAGTLHRDEEHMFDGMDPCDRDPRLSLHVEEVPVPEPGPASSLAPERRMARPVDTGQRGEPCNTLIRFV